MSGWEVRGPVWFGCIGPLRYNRVLVRRLLWRAGSGSVGDRPERKGDLIKRCGRPWHSTPAGADRATLEHLH